MTQAIIETYTGRKVDLLKFREEDVSILDIARSLSREPRHVGHTLAKITVAQHCVQAHDLLFRAGADLEICFVALMHDAEEAYLRDIPKPFKSIPQMAWFRELGDSIRKTILARFGVAQVDAFTWEMVDMADLYLVEAEIRQYKRSGQGKPDLVKGVVVRPDTSDDASQQRFLERFTRHRSILTAGFDAV